MHRRGGVAGIVAVVALLDRRHIPVCEFVPSGVCAVGFSRERHREQCGVLLPAYDDNCAKTDNVGTGR